ncbi:hypothetical protein Y1Q_0015446 [Alligator mississippiensis]|uniref:Uncharacterized protein n=1 Tax=Alligator mississippiensis TaxID=8496 RepID=A0A151NDP6_ALLMI|nr:hypothetical protein Y1Q_0015446 [Alligator mississippiensis]
MDTETCVHMASAWAPIKGPWSARGRETWHSLPSGRLLPPRQPLALTDILKIKRKVGERMKNALRKPSS